MTKIKINYNDTFGTKHSRDFYRGASFHYSGQWMLGIHYICDQYNTDYVVHDQVLLACAKSHLSSLDNKIKPEDWIRDDNGNVVGVKSIYWDFVLSGITGKTPGVRINQTTKHWETCEDINHPVWVDTGVKACFEYSDMTQAQKEDLISNFIVQSTGQNAEKAMSQKATTDELNRKEPKIDIDSDQIFSLIENITYDGESVPFLGTGEFTVYKSAHEYGDFNLGISLLYSDYFIEVYVETYGWEDVELNDGVDPTNITLNDFSGEWGNSYTITIVIVYDVAGEECQCSTTIYANMVDDTES